MPSQFSHEILNANPYAYLDDAPARRAPRPRRRDAPRAARSGALAKLAGSIRRPSPKCAPKPGPTCATPTNCTTRLLTLDRLAESRCRLTERASVRSAAQHSERNRAAAWQRLLRPNSSRKRRASRAPHVEAASYWVRAERTAMFAQIFPCAQFRRSLPRDRRSPAASARRRALRSRHRLDAAQPARSPRTELAQSLGTRHLRNRQVALAPRSQRRNPARQIHRCRPSPETEWCDRRLLARIHRLTVGELRKQIQPVTPAQFMRWLLRWQHVAPSTQLLGERGTLEVLRQLQGYEAPANAWERQILARRIADYDPEDARSALPHRRRRLGTPLAASRHARRLDVASDAPPRHPHQRRAHRFFRPRRSRLDDAAPRTRVPKPQTRA